MTYLVHTASLGRIATMQGYPPPFPPQPPIYVVQPPPQRHYAGAIITGGVALFFVFGALICLGFAFNYSQIPATVQLACALGSQQPCQQWQTYNDLHAAAILGAIGCGAVAFGSGIAAVAVALFAH